jgi:hypothetical protein
MPTFYINKASSKVVCPTLVEKSLLAPALRAYIWVITNDSTEVKTYVTAAEQSTQLQRYNKFTLTEKANPNSLNGELELTIGQYKYEIYEISTTDLANLASLSAANYTILTLVEQGIMKCQDPASTPNTEYPNATVTNTEFPG